MASRNSRRALLLSAAACVASAALFAQSSSPQRPGDKPFPPGQRIDARDGDMVFTTGDARLRVVRRIEGNVRAIYNADQHWVVLLVDKTDPVQNAPDGRVDATYNFRDLSGDWPLGERWEGRATFDDYTMVGRGVHTGYGLTTASGLVQLFSPSDQQSFRDPAAAAVLTYKGAGSATPGRGLSFDETEAREIASMRETFLREAQRGGSGGETVSTGAAPAGGSRGGGPLPSSGIGQASAVNVPPGGAPVRVGGTVRSPRKIVDVAGVLPDAARAANITGVVILEITVGADGSVTNAKVLRSIPMLDEAALTAVRQWRYEPTLLNGAPVPVLMTVTVNFR